MFYVWSLGEWRWKVCCGWLGELWKGSLSRNLPRVICGKEQKGTGWSAKRMNAVWLVILLIACFQQGVFWNRRTCEENATINYFVMGIV